MSLQVSSSKSESESRKRSRKKTSQGERDLPLKLAAASALSASGYYCGINIILSAAQTAGLADVTDVDVLAVQHGVNFASRIIGVSCKGGTRLSAAREVFHLRGVLDYMGSDQGILLLERKPIDSHIRDLARQLGVHALSGPEVDHWVESAKRGLDDPEYFRSDLHEAYGKAQDKYAGESLSSFLQFDFWYNRDFRNVQNLLAHFRALRVKPTGKQPWHSVQFLEAASHFSLSVLQLCRHVQEMGLSEIRDTVPTYLFGGHSMYKSRRDLYSKLTTVLENAGVLDNRAKMPPLEPPYAPALAELVLRFIERPHASTRVPLVLQDALWRALGAKGLPPREDTNSLAAEKLAVDLLEVMGAAGEVPWIPEL